MRKALTVAMREYRAMVATKAFILSLLVMPLLMFGGLLAVTLMNRLNQAETLTIAIWDPDDVFFSQLNAAAEARNRQLSGDVTADPMATSDEEAASPDAGEEPASGTKMISPGRLNGGSQLDGPLGSSDRIVLRRVEQPELGDEDRLALSAEVRQKKLHAFVEVPPELKVWLAGSEGRMDDVPQVAFYAESSGLDPARRWLTEVINQTAKDRRFLDLGLQPAQVAVANLPVPMRAMALAKRQSDGTVSTAETRDPMTAMFVPMGIMMMMFMVVMMAAQPMLETVLEEKSLRIAEVLLGSCNPTQLMLGKLLGTVAGSLTIFSFYMLGGFLFSWNQNLMGAVPWWVLPWFFLFQMLAVLFYSSIFMAIGVSVSQLKDAQPMMMPVWLVLMVPLMTWFVLVQKPDGALAFWLSMFPPTASTVMVLRISTGITVPLWQILLSLTLLLTATGLVVYTAGRIFRIGLLWQGKAPKMWDLLSWAWAKN
jgi:ABC-2 type transport system permease protein